MALALVILALVAGWAYVNHRLGLGRIEADKITRFRVSDHPEKKEDEC